jgi:hypothetical protein
MGLKINKEIETINKGIVSDPYARIESYYIDKAFGIMRISVALFADRDEASMGKFVYHEDILDLIDRAPKGSPIATSIVLDGNSMDYPTIFDLPLSVPEEVTQDIYETQNLVRTVKYYDFDDEGNVVEKTREETYQDRVKVGTESVAKSKIDLSVLGSNPYAWAYDKLKPKLEEIFGVGNVIDF